MTAGCRSELPLAIAGTSHAPEETRFPQAKATGVVAASGSDGRPPPRLPTDPRATAPTTGRGFFRRGTRLPQNKLFPIGTRISLPTPRRRARNTGRRNELPLAIDPTFSGLPRVGLIVRFLPFPTTPRDEDARPTPSGEVPEIARGTSRYRSGGSAWERYSLSRRAPATPTSPRASRLPRRRRETIGSGSFPPVWLATVPTRWNHLLDE